MYTRCIYKHVAFVQAQYYSERLAGLSCVKPCWNVHELHGVLGFALLPSCRCLGLTLRTDGLASTFPS